MNAQSHAIATAGAHALAHAGSAGSVYAKRREGTAQDRTTPNGVFSRWSPPIHSTSSVTRKAAERFWSKVDFQPGDLCWTWMGIINHRGYGQFMSNGVNTTAHRVAYDIANGPVPDGLQCGHLCHNPPCVRPDHLEAMTAKENIRQRDERMGRIPGSALSSSERNRRYRAKKKAQLELERAEAEMRADR